MISYQPRAAGDSVNFHPAVRAGGFVFVSGQASTDSAGQVVHDTLEGEMRRSIEHVTRILGNEGLTWADVVQVRSYVARQEDLAEYNRLYRELIAEPRPTRTTLVGCLGTVVKFELDVTAYAGESRRA